MRTNLQKWLSVVLFTFMGAFFGYSAQPGEPMKAIVIGAFLTGVTAVWHLMQAPPTVAEGALGDHEASVIANIESLMMRRVVSDPNITALLERFEKAAGQALDMHSAMIGSHVVDQLKAIQANPPLPVLQAMLANVEVAASKPQPTPLPANGTSKERA